MKYSKLILLILMPLLSSCDSVALFCVFEGIEADFELCEYNGCSDFTFQEKCESVQEVHGICEWDSEIEMCVMGESE